MHLINMKKTPRYKYFFGIADLITVFISFFISIYVLRKASQTGIWEFINQSVWILIILFLLSAIFLFVFQYNNLYKINIILNRSAHLTGIIKALYYGALNIVLVSLLIKSNSLLDSRLIIFTFILVALPLLYLIRVELLRYIFIILKNNKFKRNIVVVGDGRAGKILATKLMFENPVGIEIVGFVDDDYPINTEIVSGTKVIGHLKDLKDILALYKIDEIVVAMDDDNHDRLLSIIDHFKTLDVNVRVTSELFKIVSRKVVTEKYAEIPVIDVSPHYNNTVTLGLKRAFDITASVAGLCLLSPLFFVITALVILSSPGPIFFKQSRIGRYGNAFQFYKFRSMRVVKGEDEHRKKMMIEFMKQGKNQNSDTKIINESRITWIGKIIRKTSLDELPQLFNVIKGEMSLVGPRPCLPYEYENYDEWQKRRVSVIPGCTGVWQVLGRSQVSFKDSVVLDLYYINNMSPWMDLQLILQTIPTMVLSKGGK
jgi:exopolysaccharide biosynthesis polyprenyl glycosylphosphotransferase